MIASAVDPVRATASSVCIVKWSLGLSTTSCGRGSRLKASGGRTGCISCFPVVPVAIYSRMRNVIEPRRPLGSILIEDIELDAKSRETRRRF